MANSKNITFDQLSKALAKIKAGLDGKANTSHGTHVSYGTTATALTSGGKGVVGTSPSVARADHTHTLPAYPTALKSPGTLTINQNDKGTTTYNGASDVTVKITPDSIGAAPASHGQHVLYPVIDPKVAGTAAKGTSSRVAREDHVHPLQKNVSGSSGSCTGNAATATKLQTPRTIGLSGILTGSASFDGSSDITISTAVANQPVTGNWFKGILTVSTAGVTELGKYLDFHNTGTTTTDYDVRLQCTTANGNTVNLPGNTGTLALLSDNVASATQLKNARTLTIGNTGKSFNGTGNVSWTLDEIGAAAKNHGIHVNYSTTDPMAHGDTPTPGTSNTVSRGDHVHPKQTSVSGNAGTATKLATARTLTIGNTGKTFNGSANVSWSLGEIGAIPLTGSSAISGNLEFAQSNTTTRGIIGSVGGNDYWRIVGGATASNSGYLEIATADDASEPIYVRQYGSGKFGTLTRSATLLDDSGNTSFPGTVSATGGFSGNASSATKLKTTRSINGTNFDGTANITTAKWGTARKINDVSVDGSADVAIPIKFWRSTIGDNNSKPYHRILTSNTVTGQWVDKVITVMGSGNYDGGPFGIFRVILRTNGTGSNSSIKIEWMVRKGFGLDSIVANFINKSGSTQADIFYKSAGSYNSITWTILGEGDRSSGNYNTSWTKINTAATTTEVYTEAEMKALKSYTSTLVQGSDVGNVNASNTSAQLTTARTINGTSFNGTTNITTANWGTARTLTIGNSSKSVNGSVNVNWSLSEIGAAASNHNHDSTYLKLSGGTMTGNITFAEVTSTSYPANSSRIVWSGSTDGAEIYYRVTAADKGQLVLNLRDDADATIGIALNGAVKATFDTNGYYSGKANQANTLATARTLTIGNTGKAFNGSGNVSWSLSEIGAASSSHTHNNIVSRGSVTAESGTTRPAVGGLSMTQAYNNGYPFSYGNVLSMKGQGDGELFIGWSGTSGGQAPVYVRSKRDTGDANWSEWAQIYTSSLTTKTVSSGSLTLGTELYQYAAITSNTTIKLPSTSAFTEIHLFFNWPANVSVTMPSGVKWQQGVMYGPGHVHEFVFTYVKNIGWLGGCVVYG